MTWPLLSSGPSEVVRAESISADIARQSRAVRKFLELFHPLPRRHDEAPTSKPVRE